MKVVQALTEGHPDKVCDQIADALVDEYLRRDPQSRIDLSVMGSHGMLTIGGEVCSDADFDAGALAKKVYAEIGYTDEIEPFVNIDIHPHDPNHMHRGSDGTVFVNGYATRETREMLPLPVVLVNALARRLDEMRKSIPGFDWMRPDGKVQLVMSGAVVKVVTVLLQHEESVDHSTLQQVILDRVVAMTVGSTDGAQVNINPIGCFSAGGLGHSTGSSNRKVATDTYGGLIPFGSGGLSGKDPGRAERAGAYMTRYAARQLVKQGLADNVIIRAAYSLGKAEPVALEAKSGDGKDLTEELKKQFDFRPAAIVERLNLRRPIYRATSNYGHFGKEGLPWEE
ncbi:MAG: methionine adenosyltransferase domain-containing protein [Patescibacteria group bacterium]